MIALKYKKWDDITIPVYQEIIDIAQGDAPSEDVFMEREIDILAVLCDSDRESLSNLLLDEYAQLAHDARFLRKMPYYEVPRTITLQGVEYRVVVDMHKFTLAQYTEYNALRADANTNIARLIACLLVPKSAKCYADNYDVGEVVEAIVAELPYYKAYGILHFFQLAQSVSAISTLRSQERKTRTMARKATTREERERLHRQARQLRRAYTSLGRCLLKM